MHWHIKGWINLGAPQELSTEALSGFPGLPVSPTSKPSELWFSDSFPNSLLIHLMCLLCPGPFLASQQGRGRHQLTRSGAGGAEGAWGSPAPLPSQHPRAG